MIDFLMLLKRLVITTKFETLSMVGHTQIEQLNSVDCALFDIDGVLVDVRDSYSLAIKMTIEFMTKLMIGTSFSRKQLPDTLLLKFKQTGGFNNEVDICYAIILALMSRPPNELSSDKRHFLFKVAENADETGLFSVEEYLSKLSTPSHIKKLKADLAYPAPVGKSLLPTVFDEYFYGPALFQEQHNMKPLYYHGKPLIENDKMIINDRTLKIISKRFHGNIATISGRSRIAAQHTLRPLFKIFNPRASVFLEDEDRKYWKPSPYSIKRAMNYLGAKTAFYVGDSVEDLYMAKQAERDADNKILFVGVYGSSVRPDETLRKFIEGHADIVIRNVNSLFQLVDNTDHNVMRKKSL
jgi:HAD superfamily phosphatase